MSLSVAETAKLRVVAEPAAETAPALPVDDQHGQLVGASLALALLRAIGEAAYVMDCDGRVTFVNSAGLRDLGKLDRTPRIYGSYLWDLWPDAPADQLRRAVAEAGEGEAVVLDLPRCAGGGAPARECSISISPVEDSTGRVSKVLALVRAG